MPRRIPATVLFVAYLVVSAALIVGVVYALFATAGTEIGVG